MQTKDDYIDELERNLYSANQIITTLLMKLGGEVRLDQVELVNAPRNLEYWEDKAANKVVIRTF